MECVSEHYFWDVGCVEITWVVEGGDPPPPFPLHSATSTTELTHSIHFLAWFGSLVLL